MPVSRVKFRLTPYRHWLATLKFRIVALAVCTGILSAVGASTAVLHSAQAGMERVVLASAKADRDRSATLLGSKVTVVTNALAAVARRAPAEVWKDPAAMGRYLLDKPATASFFAAVFAVDTQGQVLVRIEGDRLTDLRANIAETDYFRRAMASDQPVISDAFWSPILHAPVVALAIPVLAADGSHRGIIAATLLLQSTALFDDLRSAGDDDGVKDLVIDRAGRILAHADPLRLMQAAQSEPGLEVVVPEWIAVGSPIDTAGVARIEGDACRVVHRHSADGLGACARGQGRRCAGARARGQGSRLACGPDCRPGRRAAGGHAWLCDHAADLPPQVTC